MKGFSNQLLIQIGIGDTLSETEKVERIHANEGMGAAKIKKWYHHLKMTTSQLRVTNILVDLLASEIVKE